MSGFRWFLLLGVFVAFFGGCEKKDFTKEPAVMHWDRDMCERCKMAISERKFAVQGVDSHNRVHKFDDIGCLILWHKREHPEVKFIKIWVADAKTGKWIDAKKACYKKGFITPMGYGYGALEHGKNCLRFEDVEKAVERMDR